MNNTLSSSSSSSPLPKRSSSSVAQHMHKAPRFGHSNNIALLASRSHGDPIDYAHGVFGFCLFLGSWFVVWMLVLFVLKCCCGVRRVGCAARGQTLDVQALKAQGIRKQQRKRLILRTWRVQTTFLLSSVALFMVMACWNKLGIIQIVKKVLPALQQINQSIQVLAYQGLQISNSIHQSSLPLINNNQNLTVLLDSHHRSSNCPLANQLPWPLYQRTIQVGLQDLTQFVNTTVQSARTGWSQVVSSTRAIDVILYAVINHVYVVRFWMLVTCVANAFLLIGVVLTQHYVVHPPLSCFLAYIILPMFMVCIGVALAALCGLSAMLLVNADFCAGGPAPGSAVGTILDMMYHRGMQQNSFVYETFFYYLNNCVNTNPFASTSESVKGMGHILETVASWRLTVNATVVHTLSKKCQKELSEAMAQLGDLTTDLQSVQGNLQSALDLAQCQNIYPIFQQITRGPLCTESVNALTWMWSTMLVMVVLGFIMVSCRAGLYNAILRAPPKHGQIKYQAREFEEYKQYMTQHFDDADQWKFQPSPKRKVGDLLADEAQILQPNETFDTAVTTKPSSTESSSDEEDFCLSAITEDDYDDERDTSKLRDVPLYDSIEADASMVDELLNLGQGLDQVVQDLEALEESMDRAESHYDRPELPRENSGIFKTPIRHDKNQHLSSSSPPLFESSVYSTLLTWRYRVFPHESINVVIDGLNDEEEGGDDGNTELKPLTPTSLHPPPMAPRKTRLSVPRTRHNQLS